MFLPENDILFQYLSEDDRPAINLNGEEISSTAEIQPGVFSCGHQTSEMFINFINPNYPAHDSTTGSCHFRILVERPEVCQVTNPKPLI